MRILQFLYCTVNLLYSREHISGGRSSIIEKVLLLVPHDQRIKIQSFTEKKIQKWNSTHNPFFFPSTIVDIRRYFDPGLFDRIVEMDFEGKKYMCVKNYDKFLRNCYGDYMKLPPEKERVLTHHPIVVDTESNYKI